MNACLPSNTGHTQRIVPNGLFEIIFYLNNKPVSCDDKRSISDNILLSGHQSGYYDVEVKGQLSLFAIYFHPYGLSRFLNLPLNELFNESIPLRFLLKDFVNQMEDKLSGLKAMDQQVAIVEDLLLAEMKKNEEKHQHARIRHAIDLINLNRGVVDIEYLASESCYSRKQFERQFADMIGTSPKQFLKIIRFQNAIYQRTKQARQSLTELAHGCGYYDQAHMINDFKTLTGYTPQQYFGICEPFSDYFE